MKKFLLASALLVVASGAYAKDTPTIKPQCFEENKGDHTERHCSVPGVPALKPEHRPQRLAQPVQPPPGVAQADQPPPVAQQPPMVVQPALPPPQYVPAPEPAPFPGGFYFGPGGFYFQFPQIVVQPPPVYVPAPPSPAYVPVPAIPPLGWIGARFVRCSYGNNCFVSVPAAGANVRL